MGKTEELKTVASSSRHRQDDDSDDSMGYGYGSMNVVQTRQKQQECEEQEEAEEKEKPIVPMSERLRLFKTACMLGIYLGLGLWSGVVNTTNVDMVNLYNCTYDEFNRAASTKSIGVMAGSFIGAAISDRFRKQADLCLAIVCFMGGTALAAVPWSPNLILMGALFIVNGLSHGITNVVCSSITIAIWGEAAPTPVIALHTCFTLGTAVAPLITAPFLSEVHSNNTDVSDVSTNDHSVDSILSVYHNFAFHGNESVTSTHVRIPYGMFGFWSVLIGIIFMAFFMKGSSYTSVKAKPKQSLKEMLNPAACANGHICFGVYFVVSLLFLYIFLNGRDRSLPAFLFAIANQGMDMNKTLSALLLTTYSFLGAVSRGMCAIISKWVNIKIVLFVEITVALLLQMYLAFYGLDSSTALWTITCLLVIFMSPTYPTALAWADRYIEVTGTVVGMIDIGIGLGGFTALIITGNLFQNHGSQAVFYFNFLLGILLTCVYFPLQIISFKRGDRHKVALVTMNQSSFPVDAPLVATWQDSYSEILEDDERMPLFRD